MSLRAWLLALSIFGAAPLLIFTATVIRDYTEFRQRALLEDLNRHAQNISQSVTEDVRAARNALISLSQVESAKRMDIKTLYDEAVRVGKSIPEIQAITLTTRSEIKFITTLPFKAKQGPLNQPAFVARALDEKQANVSSIFPSPVAKSMIFAVTIPIISHDGSANYALRAIIRTDLVQQLLERNNSHADWFTSVIDSDGKIVARSRDYQSFVGKSAAPQQLEAMKAKRFGVVRGKTLDGVDLVGNLVQISDLSWYIVVGVPVAVFQAPVHDWLMKLTILAAVWIALAIAITMVFANYVVRQVRRLAQEIEGTPLSATVASTLSITELRDIHQHFKSVQALSEEAQSLYLDADTERSHYQDLYDRAPCGYHSLDAQGRIIRINKTELDWLGRTERQVIGHTLRDFLTPESGVIFDKEFPLFTQRGVMNNLEMDLLRADGSVMPIILNATAIKDVDGNFVASRTTLFDNRTKREYEIHLERIAHTDPLTSISNRLAFNEAALKEVARSARNGKPLSLMLIDADNFKHINDSYGHDVGDDVLRTLARFIKGLVRMVDTAARYGGEEFVVLMPETTLGGGIEVAERLRVMFSEHRFVTPDHASFHVTVSIGVAQWTPAESDISATLRRADQALYQSKRLGRNQVNSQTFNELTS